MWVAALSTAHMRNTAERRAGPFVKVVETLAATDPAALETLRWDYDAIVADYFENNLVRQDYLITRAHQALAGSPRSKSGLGRNAYP